MTEEYKQTNRENARNRANADERKAIESDKKKAERDANRDPLSKRAGAHPVGTGLGAAAGGAGLGAAAAGAAIGAGAGPVGAAVGAAIGAAAGAIGGGMTGKAIAEEINPTQEHGFWRNEYVTRPYTIVGSVYEEYAPAYQYGWESQAKHRDKSFDEVEPELERAWDDARGVSNLTWREAREASRDAWNRILERQKNRQDESRKDPG